MNRIRLSRTLATVVFGCLLINGCTDAQPDTPTASDELSPGRTVNPTPATAGDALEGDRVTRWCEELGDAERDAPAIDLYREARTFNDEAVSQAAKTLVDPTSTSEETDKAYRQIQSTCSELGFELPPS